MAEWPSGGASEKWILFSGESFREREKMKGSRKWIDGAGSRDICSGTTALLLLLEFILR